MARGRRGTRAALPGFAAVLAHDANLAMRTTDEHLDAAARDPRALADLEELLDHTLTRALRAGRVEEGYAEAAEAFRLLGARGVACPQVDDATARAWAADPAEAAAARALAWEPVAIPRSVGLVRACLGTGAADLHRRLAAELLAGVEWERAVFGHPMRPGADALSAPAEWSRVIEDEAQLTHRLALWARVRPPGGAASDLMEVRVASAELLVPLAVGCSREPPTIWDDGERVYAVRLVRGTRGRLYVRLQAPAPPPEVTRDLLAHPPLRAHWFETGSNDPNRPPPAPEPWRRHVPPARAGAGAPGSLWTERACAHRRAEWHLNDTETGLVGACPDCGRERIACLARHRIPAAQPGSFTDEVFREAYMRRMPALGRLRGDLPRPLAADPPYGERAFDPASYATGGAASAHRGGAESVLTRTRGAGRRRA